jgi:hypothetical protein
MLAPPTRASGPGLAQHPSRYCALAATTHRNEGSPGRRVTRSFVVGSERLGEAPTAPKHSATLRVPNTLAFVGSLWQGRNEFLPQLRPGAVRANNLPPGGDYAEQKAETGCERERHMRVLLARSLHRLPQSAFGPAKRARHPRQAVGLLVRNFGVRHARGKDYCHRSTASHSAASRYGAGVLRLVVLMFDSRTRTRSWLVSLPSLRQQ